MYFEIAENSLAAMEYGHTSKLFMALWCIIGMVYMVQVMACCLIGAKPLPEPMLDYFQLGP